MVIAFNLELLRQLGLGALPEPEVNLLLSHMYETLELRVSEELVTMMSDSQLDEFEEFVDNNDDAGATAWLEINFPAHRQMISSLFEELKQEVAESASEILLVALDSKPDDV